MASRQDFDESTKMQIEQAEALLYYMDRYDFALGHSSIHIQHFQSALANSLGTGLEELSDVSGNVSSWLEQLKDRFEQNPEAQQKLIGSGREILNQDPVQRNGLQERFLAFALKGLGYEVNNREDLAESFEKFAAQHQDPKIEIRQDSYQQRTALQQHVASMEPGSGI